MNTKTKIRLIINALVFLAVLAAWIWMALSAEGILSSSALRSLRYFTVLSNFLEAAACAAFLISSFGRKGQAPRWVRVLKYVAAVQVSVTFLTVVFVLVPIWGFVALFSDSNLIFHLIVPLAAFFEFAFFEKERPGLAGNLFAVLPVLVYGAAYVINIIINGMGGNTQETTNDWYHFLDNGWWIGALLFAFVILIAFGVGLLLRLTKKKTPRS